MIFKPIKTNYEISLILNFSTNTILLKIKFKSELSLTVKFVWNTNSVPVSCNLCKTPVEGPGNTASAPILGSKNQTRKFPPWAPAWPTGFMLCSKVHMGARRLPVFTVTGSWADTKLFRWKHIHGTHKCSAVCYRLLLSCMVLKQRDGKKRKNLKYTTLQHSKLKQGEKISSRKIRKEGTQCFLAIRREETSVFIMCFIFILPFVNRDKKKKKKASYHCGFYGYRSKWWDHSVSWTTNWELCDYASFPPSEVWNIGGVLAVIQNLQDATLAYTCIIF